ncbi:hypothetical protein LOC68_05105 [Blastopirellula sp. JC732]|uniref:HTTM-like domain-containing protein n=1 Tax=Blastopirellula sediminis TaxID=2894196 RepID=A0A9X1SI43_9BACT|nr:hypothetical protein [Blastopirellula sediminis]MCC9609459.1 hypothetical protein [Blastopirellula sediminis]MCC9627764.1 hypothetical protein [Blastopirellula sediminis]
MIAAIQEYFADLARCTTAAWTYFWFRASDAKTLSILRIALACVALLYILGYTSDLTFWFAADGVMPVARVYEITGITDPEYGAAYWSLLYYFQDPTDLWILHAVTIVTLLALAAGFFSRVTAVMAFVLVLSYAQRSPIVLSGLIEPLLCPLMLYLCLGPCGAHYSIDAIWRRRAGKPAIGKTYAANIATRLTQVHLSMFFVMMALSKLGASYVWWNGAAMWNVLARPESPLVDFKFLRSSPLLVYAWTHAMVLFELAYPVAIWVRPLRPLMIAVSIPIWILYALASGNWLFALLMLVMNLAFFTPLEVKPKSEVVETNGKAEAAADRIPAHV